MLYQDEKCIYSTSYNHDREWHIKQYVFGSKEESIILFIYFLLNVLGRHWLIKLLFS